MNSDYQMYLKASSVTFRFPVLPEEITVSYGSDNDKLRVCNVGEVTIPQDSDAAVIKFKSFFPDTYFQGCSFEEIPAPADAVKTVLAMKESKKPIRFTQTGGMGVSMYCTIEDFEPTEKGGDVGTIHFSIKLREYRETNIRQIKVNETSKKALISGTRSRTDPTLEAQTYTVKKGDCLYNIAKKVYGSGEKYMVIYHANRGVIGVNPNLIYPGQVLQLRRLK